ncbi:MAG: hypothetical protein IJ848_00300 [Alphaproteobacteria bacterium]|nr:hypothetical protein [Alphaproteobacteria bacterium]
MTKFLSKVFLSGILLTSINGYCDNNDIINGFAGIESPGFGGGTVEFSQDRIVTQDINVGKKLYSDLSYNAETSKVTKANDDTEYEVSRAKAKLNGNTITLASKPVIGTDGKQETDESGSLKTEPSTMTMGQYSEIIPGTKDFTTIDDEGTETTNKVIGKINLDGNIAVVEKGSIVGSQEAVLDVYDGTVGLSGYIEEKKESSEGTDSKTFVFNKEDGNKLFMNLSNVTINDLFPKYSDSESDLSKKSTLIEEVNSNETSLFENITHSNLMIKNVPSVFKIESEGAEPVLKMIDEKYCNENNLLGKKIIYTKVSNKKLKALFNKEDNDTIKGDINAQSEIENVINLINSSSSTDNKAEMDINNVTEEVSLHELTKLVGQDSNKVLILIKNYELEKSSFDFKNIKVENSVKETEDMIDSTKKVDISNLDNNVEYNPINKEEISREFNKVKARYNGGTIEEPHVMNNLTANDSDLTVKGVVQVKGLLNTTKATINIDYDSTIIL